jgi:REP element-mobilizing transposase RayT
MEQAKFKNKYRTGSCRLQGYDYSSNGMYFITICCSNRKSFFGEIVDGKMVLNELGKFAYREFKNTENIRENVTIDEFIIMPDHMHGIISIDYQVKSSDKIYINTAVETNCNSSLQNSNNWIYCSWF